MLVFILIVFFALWVWSFAGVLVAAWDFICGRFLLAAIVMCSALFCLHVTRHVVIGREIYLELLGIGFGFEVVKWSVRGVMEEWHLRRVVRSEDATASLGRKSERTYRKWRTRAQIIDPGEVCSDCGRTAKDITAQSRRIL